MANGTDRAAAPGRSRDGVAVRACGRTDVRAYGPGRAAESRVPWTVMNEAMR
ncbi:hypothetical protein ACF09K_16360 [Streptomyces sp. NPDC014882]|uniref:hypothetical protein n=1 Tax=Streptomyces sp. NPDC014882 TaxID=3364927 RepID=UPI0036FAE105